MLQPGIQTVQPFIRGIRRNHFGFVTAETALKDQCTLGGAELHRIRMRQQTQQGVAQGACGKLIDVILDLVEQNGHKIHHGAHLGMTLQMSGHVGVILDGVQVCPGQNKIARFIIAVIWLVHMPEEDKINRFFHGRKTPPEAGCQESD